MELRAIHERCSGCGVCKLACALENYREVNPAKALLRIEGRFPAPGDYRVHLCDQCGECAEICPVEAITLDEDGVYRIDEATCTECGTCVETCPHGVIMVGKDSDMPSKCILCGECARACPRGAIQLVETEEKEGV